MPISLMIVLYLTSMNGIYRKSILFVICLCRWFPGFGQSESKIDNSDETKIISNWKFLEHRNSSLPVLRLSQRRFDSPFFCDELIPFKNGFIINSITSNRSRGMINVETSFYYFNLLTKNISRLMLPGVDTIESIIFDKKDGLCYSYKRNGNRVIACFQKGTKQNILTGASVRIKTGLDTAAWIKLVYRS